MAAMIQPVDLSRRLASSSSASSASSSSLDTLSQLPTYLQPPSQGELQSSALQHPLLSTALSSSASFSRQIAALQGQVQSDRTALDAARQAAVAELSALRDDVGKSKAALTSLPGEVEQVEDLIQRSEKMLRGSNGAPSLPAELAKQQQAVASLRFARDYFAILARVQTLEDAVLQERATEVKGKDGDSVADAQLEHLIELAHLCRHAEDLARNNTLTSTPTTTLRFVPFLQSKVAAAYAHLVACRTNALREALTRAEWPPLSAEQAEAQGKPIRDAAQVLDTMDVRTKWTALTSLQLVGAKLGLAPTPSCLRNAGDDATSARPGSAQYTPLYTTELIAEPYLLRFRFHFDSSRSTNRLDKPEWYLNHVLGLVRSLLHPFAAYPRRGAVLKLSNVALQRYGAAFTTTPESDILHTLLRPLQAKVNASMDMLLASTESQSSSLLAHTVGELIRFDDEVEDELPATFASTAAGTATARPIRLSDDILGSQSWFDAWVRGERASAHETLDEILADGDAWTIGNVEGDGIDEDEGDAKAGSWSAASSQRESKTTRSARSLVALLRGLTTTYTPLPELSQRLEFLTEIQLPLLRSYHHRLTRSLDAFESLSSAFARAIPGGIEPGSGLPNADADMVRGLRGLSRLLKAYLSALHVHAALKKWSEESFFLELSHDLLSTDEGRRLVQSQKDEAEQRELDGESLGSLLRRGLGAGRSSGQARNTAAATSPATATATSIWDEPLSKYHAIIARASEGIKRLVVSEVLESLRPYAQQNWIDGDSAGGGGGDDDDDANAHLPTPSLLSSLTTLHTHLTHFLPILPRAQSAPIYRAIASDIASALVSRAVVSGGSKRFDERGGQRFEADWRTGWGGVIQQVIRASPDRASAAMGHDPLLPWSALRDAAVLLASPTASAGGETLTLMDIARVLWEQDDDAWTACKGRLGLSRGLGRQKAREIVRRRIESGR